MFPNLAQKVTSNCDDSEMSDFARRHDTDSTDNVISCCFSVARQKSKYYLKN